MANLIKLKIICFLFLVFSFSSLFSQATIKTRPETHTWQRIYDGILGAKGDGIDTTSAISIRDFKGSVTLWIKTDTTGAAQLTANKSDSCLTVWFQLKRYYKDPNTGVIYQDWGGHYAETNLAKSRIDTVARSKVNVAGANFYIQPAKDVSDGSWTWADSLRFILSIGVGDSLTTTVDVGGQ